MQNEILTEVWRFVPDYEEFYMVSNFGRVKSLGRWTNACYGAKQFKQGKILKLGKDTYGYPQVRLYKDDVNKTWKVHRLVSIAFPDLVGWTKEAKGKPFSEIQINHKDENKENNRVENLEWCDSKYNNNYGTHTKRIAKLTTNGKTSKQVYQYTLDGQLVKVWPSLSECGRNGFNKGNIGECCNGNRKTSNKYKWSYNHETHPLKHPAPVSGSDTGFFNLLAEHRKQHIK